MAEQNSIFGLNFNPELQNNEEDFKKALLGQAPTTRVEAGNNFLNMAGLPMIGQQPLGPASPFLPSGEKAVYAMTPEELAARQAARGPIEQNPNKLLGFVQDVLNTPGEIGRRFDEFAGTAMRALTPEEELGYTPPSLGDVLATAGIRDAEGNVFGSGGRREAITGPTGLPPISTPALESAVTTTPDMGSEVAATVTGNAAIDPTSDEAILARRAAREAAAREAMAAQPRLTTVGGASLSEFLGGEAMPEQGFARAEREMAGRGITLTPEQFNELSAQREARIGGGGETATERDTRRAEARVTSSQNIPTDVREAMNTPAGRLTRDQIKRLTDWQGSTQGQAYMAEQEAAEAEANKPFEPREVEIGGNTYIQFGPKDYRRVEEETPTEPKKSAIESLREEGVKAGLPENLIRQSIASRLGLDLFDEEVMNWMAGNTDTMPSVEGASESSTPSGDTEASDVLMIGTDGKTRKVPAKDKEAALKAGYTLK